MKKLFQISNGAYDPKKVETKIYQLWEKSGFFNPDKLPAYHKKPYTITMAPPNITGHIHIGHALENMLSDVLIRWKRMQGYKALFLPGKDHASIAAQYVVEKSLRKEGKTRFDLGREKFLKRVWQWMKDYGNSIDEELKMIGLSCDWSRKRFTMDKNYQEAVKAAFKQYQKKGYIYQGERIVNWCLSCQTGISDLEVEHEEKKGKLWYLKYPLAQNSTPARFQRAGLPSPALSEKGGTVANFITVATTRPETMLGDTAVAVNPNDKRYQHLIGQKILLPIQNREISIIADKRVDQKFGTGAVKVTPAHDLTDYEIGQQHNLARPQVIDQNGKMTKEAGVKFQGLTIFQAREKVVQELEKEGLIEKIEDYSHRVGHCERCKTTIEPLISKQWFIRMEKLAKMAIEAVKRDKIKFVPSSRKKIYLAWFANVKDWCISRQLWWGHKIPIKGTSDVLDTWFSSALWPFAVLGWPQKTKDLKTYYPTDVISSAREISYLWIARMIFSGMEFMDKIPFKYIYTHATILDKKGKKMSKSLGNVVSPVDLIEKYGTDATRFGLAWQVTGAQDIHFDEGTILMGKKFCNKLWNATRFVLQQISKSKIKNQKSKIPRTNSFGIIRGRQLKVKNLTSADRKILKALDKTTKSANKDLENFQFGKVAHALYDFFWHDFCDKYIEESKKQANKQTQQVLLYVLLSSLKLLHPFMPFITEEIYQKLPLKNKKKCLMVEQWPTAS